MNLRPYHLYSLQCCIVHLTSYLYTHEQNGLAEKKHRKIINQGLDMLAQASIPLTFWDDFFYATMFMINRFPTYVLNHLSPLEKLFHVKPNLYFLKVFGCLCFSFF